VTRRRPAVLVAAAGASAACSIAVGLIERGAATFSAPLRPYLGDVTLIGSGFSFLRSFADSLPVYSAQVRTHPPGLVLGLWGLDWAHLQGPGWAAAVVIAGAALTTLVVAAVGDWWLVAATAVGGAVLWPAPAPAGMFAGVAALALLVAIRGRRPATSLAAGLLLALALLLTYASLFALALAIAALAWRRRFTALGLVVGACLATLFVVQLTGFSYLAGLGRL
jgi:hypothetical protein